MTLLPPGSPAPDFACDAHADGGRTRVESFRAWARGRWTVLLSHPRDATPICSTEMLELVRLRGEFEARKVGVLALSTDTVEEHASWVEDLERVAGKGQRVWFPLLADVDGDVARRYGMLQRRRRRAEAPAGSNEDQNERDAAGRLVTSRTVYVVSPELDVEYVAVSPINTGRSFAEILRVVDSLQVTAAHDVVGTPATWRGHGDRVVILPSASVSASVPVSAPVSAPASAGSEAEAETKPRVRIETRALLESETDAAPGSSSSPSPGHSPSFAAVSAPAPDRAEAATRSGIAVEIAVEEVVTPYLSFASVKPVFGGGAKSMMSAAKRARGE